MARPEVVCYHEAGHAILRFIRRIPVEWVHLWETDKAPGQWEGAMYPGQNEKPLPFPLNVEDWVSSVAAEDIQFRERSAGAECDVQKARNAAVESVETEHVDAVVQETIEQVRAILAEPENWAVVKRIADRLLVKVEEAAKLDRQLDRQAQARQEELQEWFDAK